MWFLPFWVSQIPNSSRLPETTGSKIIIHFLTDWYSVIEHLAFSKFLRTSKPFPGNTLFNPESTEMVINHPRNSQNIFTIWDYNVNSIQGKMMVVAYFSLCSIFQWILIVMSSNKQMFIKILRLKYLSVHWNFKFKFLSLNFKIKIPKCSLKFWVF